MASAELQVNVISSEMIQPSSPTPAHMKYFKLSILDQYANNTYMPSIIHYQRPKCGQSISQVLGRLKQSLAEALSLYYPLAGRVKDHLFIDCNDEGALFIQARVDGTMSTFFNKPDLDRLFEFIPSDLCGPINKPADSLVQVCVQVNIFSCGGISIGLCNLHRVMDGITIAAFLECWAKVARFGLDKAVKPDLTSGSYLFPPRKLPIEVGSVHRAWLFKGGKSVMRRFVFDNKAISTLKANAASELVPHPSRVEVVACFIWKCIVKSLKSQEGDKSSVLVAAMDLRPKTTPTLSENSLGNIMSWTVINHIADSTKEFGIQGFVSLLRKGFLEVDGDYVKRMQGDKGGPVVDKLIEETNKFQSKEKREAIVFSSTNKFGTPEKLDFGWGNPLWVSHIRGSTKSTVYVNQITLANTCWDDGIEAWLLLGEEEMTILENDKEFLTLAASNPSIPQLLGGA